MVALSIDNKCVAGQFAGASMVRLIVDGATLPLHRASRLIPFGSVKSLRNFYRSTQMYFHSGMMLCTTYE